MVLKKVMKSVTGEDYVINKYQSVIDTPTFQRLRWIMNCDLAFLIYSSLTTNRLEHSVGTTNEVKEIVESINEDNEAKYIDKGEKATVEMAGLTHDIGHSAFSHALEQVLMRLGEPSHDEKALEKLEILKPKIEKVPDVNFSLLQDILRRKNPLSQLIWSLVGADIFDYLTKDSKHSGVPIGSDMKRIKTYAFFDGERYGIDTKAKLEVEDHINQWLKMYAIVYLRKGSCIWKGVLRTGFYELVKSGRVKVEDVWDMMDDELLTEMKYCGGLPKKVYYRIKNREQAQTFLTLKIEGQEHIEEIRRKPLYVRGLSKGDLKKITEHFENVDNIMEFERNMEKSLGFELGDITVAEMPHIDTILEPTDIDMYDRERGWTSLYRVLPWCPTVFSLYAEAIYGLRIATRKELRKEAFNNVQKVLDVLMSYT